MEQSGEDSEGRPPHDLKSPGRNSPCGRGEGRWASPYRLPAVGPGVGVLLLGHPWKEGGGELGRRGRRAVRSRKERGSEGGRGRTDRGGSAARGLGKGGCPNRRLLQARRALVSPPRPAPAHPPLRTVPLPLRFQEPGGCARAAQRTPDLPDHLPSPSARPAKGRQLTWRPWHSHPRAVGKRLNLPGRAPSEALSNLPPWPHWLSALSVRGSHWLDSP